jgi:hypothetical protein
MPFSPRRPKKAAHGESESRAGARLSPAQGIGAANKKPAGFLLERIARFFAAEPQKMRPNFTRYAAFSKPRTALSSGGALYRSLGRGLQVKHE